MIRDVRVQRAKELLREQLANSPDATVRLMARIFPPSFPDDHPGVQRIAAGLPAPAPRGLFAALGRLLTGRETRRG